MSTCALLKIIEPAYRVIRNHYLPARHVLAHRAIYIEAVNDIRGLINEYLSIDDFIALMRVNRAHRQVVLSTVFNRSFWTVLRVKLGCPLDASRPLEDQVLCNMFEKAYSIAMIPPIINKILENRSEILERNEEGYLHPIAILKATKTFLKWYQAHDTQTSLYLQNVLYECGYQIFRGEASRLNSSLKERS
jgi:hypothetical protein